MSADTSARLLQLDPLLEAKNPNVRNEAAAAFGKLSILSEDVKNSLKKHAASQLWETRVSAGKALQATLQNAPEFERLKNEEDSSVSENVRSIVVMNVLRSFKPLLSDDESALKKSEKDRGNNQKQREIVDQHLEYNRATGISSTKFLSDDEFLHQGISEPDQPSTSKELDEVVTKIEIFDEENGNCDDGIERQKKFLKVLRELVNLVAEKQWYARHGGAIAICQIASTSYDRLSYELIDTILYLLIHVLILDKFNDFISGRNATAPVREQCAQALVHMLRNTDEKRREVVLEIVVQMVRTPGEKNWNIRQSGLLILKYYFAIARNDGTEHQKTFNQCFNLVIQSLDDSVDDVTGCAVKTLASILSNKEIPQEEMSQLVEKVMSHVWKLLDLEAAKEQLRAGLDALCIDLLEIVELWLRWNQHVGISRESLLTICSTIDAAFPVRCEKIVQLLEADIERPQSNKLSAEDVFIIIKQLYRILLFAPPADSLLFLEKTFITFSKIFKCYRQDLLIENGLVSQKIGNWLGCLLLDHRNPQIDVFACDVDGISSNRSSPTELMCSEEMRFLGEKEKDKVYLTRKILCAKFLAIILEALYESDGEIQGQRIDIAVQLLFIPFFQSKSIMHNLGVSIIVNEWAALYRSGITAKTLEKPPPLTIIQLADGIVRGPGKQYDEMTTIVMGLTKDCNEFIEYCVVRGFDRTSAEARGESPEDVSKAAYSIVRPNLKTEKQRESIDSRYNTLCRSIENAKMNIKSNGIRINALLSSTLFYFGNAPEKLTPQIRPIVETMQTEENDAMASEVFRGAVPLLVMFSWSRNPRPYVKVFAKAFESFSGCPIRMPKLGASSPGALEPWTTTIISMRRIWGKETDDGFEESSGMISAESRNAELFLNILCQFNASQLAEFYCHFDLSEDVDLNTFLTRLELHNSLWNRVGSRLSDQSADKIFSLVPSEDPAIRYAFAKAIETFFKSSCGDTLSKCYNRLVVLSKDLDNVNSRLSAVEVFLRLCMMDTRYLNGWATLLAPVIFPLLADQCETVRDAAGEAFRRLIPVITLENPDFSIEGMSQELLAKKSEYSNFINVLGSPSSLPRVIRADIRGGFDTSMLREYQLEGITWIRFLRTYGLHGILADDMGLGKTLQTMCSIALSVDRDEMSEFHRCSLIVCPRTLVDHWCLEWNRFFPQRVPASKNLTRCHGAEICVIAYDELKTAYMMDRVWNYIVLDEGHVMRNSKLRAWKFASQLVGKSRLILSGTPVQNSPADLWSLFAWLMPGYLGSEKQFRSQFLKKIMKCRLPKANEADLKAGSAAISQLHKLVLPFVMRRLKTEVLKELPEKNVQDYECELTEDQKEIYRFVVDRCTSSQEDVGLSSLVTLITLRKLTDHTKLVHDTLAKIGAPQYILSKALAAKSGKMEALKQLLIECEICKNPDEEVEQPEDLGGLVASGHRALIFCQWKTSAKLVSDALKSGEFGSVVSHLVLDGSVPAGDRMKMVNRFNEDKTIDVLILTTHVGGVGLNLTGADTVIFLDHDWNPMKDLQAIDRAHRLGQTRNVNVYRLITQGTVEEKVMSLAKFKLNTAQALIGADNTSMMTMETGELMNMFTLDGDEAKKKPGGGEPAAKKSKKSTGAPEEVDLASMWDESQYDDFQVDSFLRNT
ncbi:BTAF (TBP-associated factor) homolog [Caenorhabditis elegans]|uniref:BTAF (TBP-associated factor) homolog n=1 Tax=Caenorhabditis elegans TaxID=6239 RepID=G5EF07_CAEEL|nr:BTAF (TBP-associated factor) homolog [Caenorhabditis elegans]CAB02491.2 BTAF (TBP-associated factor) homolog [Caenorhabditis elegans]|eukprot:NP_496802.2 BTAF (TBP-associated factor) homolog [Caenorhabditis elegans]